MIWSRRLACLLCCLSIFGAAHAAGPQEAIDRWFDAVSGGHHARKSKSVVLHADAKDDGIEGRVTERLDTDAWRRVTTQDSRVREEGCRGGTAWVKDWNGKVLELRGRDRRDRLTEATIEALLFGDLASGIMAAGDATLSEADDAEKSTVIRFTPDDGVPFDVFLDRTTWLPAKIVRKPYDDAITLQLSDWRKVRGRKVPFLVRQTGGDSGTEATTAVRDLVAAGQAPSAPIGLPHDAAKDYRFTTGKSASGIPFNFENDHIMVEGRVNGSRPLWFMLDTGAEATIVNKARMAELSLQPFGASSVSGGGNSTDFAFADVARLEIGGVALLNQRDGVIDLAGLEKIYGMPMGGILGYDFFSRFVVRVDYDAKTIDLLEPSEYTEEGAGTKVAFVLEGGQPHVTSTITVPSLPPIESDLIVDSGAADTVNLTAPFVKAHRLLEFARKTPASGPNTMAGSEKEFFAQTSVRGKLGGITLGAFTLQDIPSNLMVGAKGAYASASFSGTVGEGVLHRFNTVYDYSRSVMILKPNAAFEQPFPARRTFGATFLSDGPDYTRFTVTGVRKESPAEAAGLKKDDVVVAADEKPASALRLADIRKLIADEGAHHVLTIQRGDEKVAIDFTVTLVSIEEK